jgi:type IV pilus assembly protein PilP
MGTVSLKTPLLKKALIVGGVLLAAQFCFLGLYMERTPDQTDPAGGASPQAAENPPAVPVAAAPVAAAQTAGSPGRLTADAVAALPDTPPTPDFVYDASGKRDPFQPFDFSPKDTQRDNLSPLERYEIGQLKLTAVLDGFEEPTAIVENAAGRGFTVRRGTKIGPNGGAITEILKDKLVIVETITDYTGVSKTQTIEMAIRTKDQKEQL